MGEESKETNMPAVKVEGDTFILCQFIAFQGVPLVLESGNTVSEVLENIAEHLDEDGERLSFCRVGYWAAPDSDDPSDVVPCGVKTIFEIQPYCVDALEEDEDE